MKQRGEGGGAYFTSNRKRKKDKKKAGERPRANRQIELVLMNAHAVGIVGQRAS